MEQGWRSFAEVVEGKGLFQEKEDSSKGIMGKADKQSIKAMDNFRKEAKSVHRDHAAPAGFDISKKVVEGVLNMQPLKEILLSLKKEIDRSSDQLEVDLALSGGGFVEGPAKGNFF